MKRPLLFLAFFGLILVSEGLSRPSKRPDGSLYFPGRGCGINEPYKFIFEMPEDTSNLRCVFFKPEVSNLQKLRECFYLCYFLFWIGLFVYSFARWLFWEGVSLCNCNLRNWTIGCRISSNCGTMSIHVRQCQWLQSFCLASWRNMLLPWIIRAAIQWFRLLSRT